MFGGVSSSVLHDDGALACLWRHCVQYYIPFLINYLLSVAAVVSGDVSPHGVWCDSVESLVIIRWFSVF